MYRETIIDNDDYTFDLQYEQGEVVAHLDVHNYSKDVYNRMLCDWYDIEDALVENGFTRVIAMPEKKGMVTKMGWEHVADVPYLGEMRGVYVWDLLLCR